MIQAAEITLMITRESDYAPYIRDAYSSDADFIANYHEEAGSGIHECINRTLTDFSRAKYFKFFRVHNENNHFVGYFGEAGDGETSDRFLVGFFVMPKYRTFITENRFWMAIHSHFQGEFYCGVSQFNYKAVNFCFMGGGVIIKNMDYNDECWYLFHFKK